MNKRVFLLIIMIVALMLPLFAKTDVVVLKLVAVVEEKVTFSFNQDGYYSFETNNENPSFVCDIFDLFGNRAELRDGKIVNSGNYSVRISGR